MAVERRACTIPERKLATMLANGLGYAAIGRVTQHNEDTIRARCLSLKLAAPRPRQPEPPPKPALRTMLAFQSVSCEDIGRAFGMTGQQVRVAARRYGLPTDAAGRAALRSSQS